MIPPEVAARVAAAREALAVANEARAAASAARDAAIAKADAELSTRKRAVYAAEEAYRLALIEHDRHLPRCTMMDCGRPYSVAIVRRSERSIWVRYNGTQSQRFIWSGGGWQEYERHMVRAYLVDVPAAEVDP